jgi:cytochrome P450
MKTLADIPVVSGKALSGNLFDFRDERLELQRRIYEECGDIGVFRLGPVKVVMISSAELAQQVLVENDESFVKSPGLRKFARPLLGNGLLTSDRDAHKKQRKLMAGAFQHKRIAAYAEVMTQYSERLCSTWSEGQVVDMKEEMMRLTLAIVGKTLFDADVTQDAHQVGEALETAMRYTMESVSSVVNFPLSWPTPKNLRTRRAIAALDRIIYRIIEERRSSGKDSGDVLSMLLLARDEHGSGMSDLAVRDEAMTLFLAGHETTSVALTFAWYLLAKNPRAAEKMYQEIDQVLGERPPRMQDLPQLPYTLQIFKEAMRLFPPAYLTGRQAIRDVKIGDYHLAKGTIVMVNIRAMHLRADVFPEPERFLPERFQLDAEKLLPRGAFIPFGAGSRVCIGNHFALMEGQLVLATLARRFALALTTAAPLVIEPLITLRPKSGISMRIHQRRARSIAA